MVGKATPDWGGPRKSPDGVDPKTPGWASKRTRKTQRDGHNSGVKIWSLCSVSSTLSHANLTNKMRGKMLLKKSSCVFLQAFSFMRLSLMLCRCDAWTCKWLYNNSSYRQIVGDSFLVPYCLELLLFGQIKWRTWSVWFLVRNKFLKRIFTTRKYK